MGPACMDLYHLFECWQKVRQSTAHFDPAQITPQRGPVDTAASNKYFAVRAHMMLASSEWDTLSLFCSCVLSMPAVWMLKSSENRACSKHPGRCQAEELTGA